MWFSVPSNVLHAFFEDIGVLFVGRQTQTGLGVVVQTSFSNIDQKVS